MKSILKGLVTAFLLVTSVIASTTQDIQIYTADNSKGTITGKSIEKAFKDAGFTISGHNDMNTAFKGKFQKTNHKMYRLFTVYEKELVLELVKISPKAALFTPLSMSIYMNNDSNDISISSMTVDGIAKITGIPANNKYMLKYGKLLRDTLTQALPNGHFEKTSYKTLKPEGKLIATFTYEMELEGTGDDVIEDELEGIQEELESSLETVGFVIAGFNRLATDFKKAGYDKYDFFDAYSLCKLPVIFPVAKIYPEAGAFAPCTVYMYKEKGSSTIHIAYPSVYNWISSLDITDKVSKEALISAQMLMDDVINEVTE